MSDRERIAFFGLRTNVSYFASHEGFAKLGTRLKACALLYETVIVEGGVYECTVTDRGAMEFVGPPKGPSDLRPRRTKRGVIAGMRMAKTDTDNWNTVFAGTVEKQLLAQFHSHIKGLPAKTSWLQMAELTDEADRRARKVSSDWTRRERDRIRELMPDASRFLREKMHENLNFDLARASLIGAELLPDGSTTPLLRSKLNEPGLRILGTGERPLHFLLPDLASATWEEIAQLRKFRGFMRLRAKLRELDDVSLSDDSVHRKIENEFLTEIERHAPRWRSVALSAGMIVLSAVPPVATAVEVVKASGDAIEMGKDVADHVRDRGSWAATLIRARHHLRARTPVHTRPVHRK